MEAVAAVRTMLHWLRASNTIVYAAVTMPSVLLFAFAAGLTFRSMSVFWACDVVGSLIVVALTWYAYAVKA